MNEELTEKQFRILKQFYQHEGYGIMVRLLDDRITVKFNSMLQHDAKGVDVVAIKDSIKGIIEAKDIVPTTLREGESKYGKDN